MKIAVIGTGGIAQKAYFPLLAVLPEISLIAVHSRTKERAQEAATRWKIPAATDEIAEIIAMQPQAALVISSTESHFPICKQLLENGIDVYAEKSLTESSALSRELALIAEKNNRILAVGYNRRYALLYQQAKELIGSRQIQHALIQKHRTEASNPSLFQQYLDDTIHQIDLMRFYCGDVQAIGTSYQMENGVLVTAASTVQLPSGGVGVITICNQSGAWQESVTLHAQDISIHVDAFQRLRVLRDDREEVYGTDRAGKWITSLKERGFYGEVAHFLHCVKTREKPMTDGMDAAKTQQLMEALVRVSGDELPF